MLELLAIRINGLTYILSFGKTKSLISGLSNVL